MRKKNLIVVYTILKLLYFYIHLYRRKKKFYYVNFKYEINSKLQTIEFNF